MGNQKLRNRLLISVVTIVILLIVVDVLITSRNNKIIKISRELQKESETVKVNISQFAINIIHNLDLGVRSYALFDKKKYLAPLNFALRDKDSIIHAVEITLRHQQYPLEEFQQLKDSINAYAAFCVKLKELYDNNQKKEFLYLADLDKGYLLWLQYEAFANKVYAFEDQINQEATRQYDNAVLQNYIVLLALLLISAPALLIMARHTMKKFSLAQELRKREIERAELLTEQNLRLERMVAERTKEIQVKNEDLENRNNEISAQNEELTAQQEEITYQRDLLASQNEKLKEAGLIIEDKNAKIQLQNSILEQQVEERTHELVQYNQQLERFTYMAAHDLRAPVARIIGLGRLFFMAQSDEAEIKNIVNKLTQSTLDLDQVVYDLGRILEIKSEGKRKVSEIIFSSELEFIQSKLKREIFDSKAIITAEFNQAPSVHSVKRYFRNILYQIIHNAIKFRHPARNPTINIQSEVSENYIRVTISDNGIGLNTEANRDQLFQFHKRFHAHVEGKGLGLYLARIQITALSGKIEMESTVDVGTIVKLYFKNLS